MEYEYKDLFIFYCVFSIAVRVCSKMSGFEARKIFKIKELTFINEFFEYERNEASGHNSQTVIPIR